MIRRRRDNQRSTLQTVVHWFVRLRWGAAGIVLLASAANWRWLGWYPYSAWMMGVGLAIAGYNAALWWVLSAERRWRVHLVTLAWAQLLLDLACLTLLTLWTGGVHSPLMSFFVFHMVFASLLLSRQMAYGGAVLSALMLILALWQTDQMPHTRSEVIALLGWLVMLLMTVYLANTITYRLRKQGRRLFRQNQRILAMSRELRRQQRAMVQHEKMVALGQLAAGMAHEIANPLASMDNLLQLIQRHPERLRPDSVVSLRDQVGRIGGIVRQLTQFAHPAASPPETVTLGDVVNSVMRMVRYEPRIARTRVSVQSRSAPAEARVCTQPRALEQVIMNIVLNALDAMAETPHPHLQIELSSNGRESRIEIADNGHGIAPDQLPRIFEPFYTTKPAGKGTGLGLFVSYNILRQLGGRLDVQSVPGQGSWFSIVLPTVLPQTGS